jgi:hypothetical protein
MLQHVLQVPDRERADHCATSYTHGPMHADH